MPRVAINPLIMLRAFFSIGLAIFSALFLALLVSGCEFFDNFGSPPLNEAQIEEIQSFEVEAELSKVERASILVLQGLGYVIEKQDSKTGFIEAKGLVSQRRAADDCYYVWDAYKKQNVQRCRAGERYSIYRRLTLAFEQIGDYTHLRLIIVIVDSKNGDRIVTNNDAHRNIFSRIEERLFLRESLNPA